MEISFFGAKFEIWILSNACYFDKFRGFIRNVSINQDEGSYKIGKKKWAASFR